MGSVQQGRPLAPLYSAAAGLVASALLQYGMVTGGRSPIVPPYSVAIALVAIAAVLLVFGLRVKRAVADEKKRVDPFLAVRTLVAARAGGLVGGAFAGIGAGLLLPLLLRTVPAAAATWLPMVVTAVCGIALLVCGVLAERWCRVPPSDGDEAADPDIAPGDPDARAAYRKRP